MTSSFCIRTLLFCWSQELTLFNRSSSLGRSLGFLSLKESLLGRVGFNLTQNRHGNVNSPGNWDCSDALHIYVWDLRMNCYFKKRRISSSLKGGDCSLPLGHFFILGFLFSLCNKVFTNTSLLLKNGIHHKPSREKAGFDGHNTIFQSTVSFLFNSICCMVNVCGKKHTKTLVNINQQRTAPSFYYPLLGTPGDNVPLNLLFA